MNLLNYPVPDLDVTFQEVSRVLQLTLGPDYYPEFKTVLAQQRELLTEAQQSLTTRFNGQENWVTEQFKKSLLSCDDPLPSSTALPIVLPPSKGKKCGQLERAAALLWAAAKLYSEPVLVEGDAPMERTQQSEVFAASRLPGRTQDQIKVRYKHNEDGGNSELFESGILRIYFVLFRSTQTACTPLSAVLEEYFLLIYCGV